MMMEADSWRNKSIRGWCPWASVFILAYLSLEFWFHEKHNPFTFIIYNKLSCIEFMT